jgi:hypothetical protein
VQAQECPKCLSFLRALQQRLNFRFWWADQRAGRATGGLPFDILDRFFVFRIARFGDICNGNESAAAGIRKEDVQEDALCFDRRNQVNAWQALLRVLCLLRLMSPQWHVAQALMLVTAVALARSWRLCHQIDSISLGESVRLKRPMRHKSRGRRHLGSGLWPRGSRAVRVRRRFRNG